MVHDHGPPQPPHIPPHEADETKRGNRRGQHVSPHDPAEEPRRYVDQRDEPDAQVDRLDGRGRDEQAHGPRRPKRTVRRRAPEHRRGVGDRRQHPEARKPEAQGRAARPVQCPLHTDRNNERQWHRIPEAQRRKDCQHAHEGGAAHRQGLIGTRIDPESGAHHDLHGRVDETEWKQALRRHEERVGARRDLPHQIVEHQPDEHESAAEVQRQEPAENERKGPPPDERGAYGGLETVAEQRPEGHLAQKSRLRIGV